MITTRLPLLFSIMTVILALIFLVFPWIDIKFSSMFYYGDSGFALKNLPIVEFVNKHSPLILICCTFVILFTMFVIEWKKNKSLNIRYYTKIIYIIAVFLIGVVLIINALFKNNLFGRARPDQISNFGGNKVFSAPFIVSHQCKTNCSFVSGHASVGFAFIAFAFITNRKYKKYLILLSVLLGSSIGFIRIISGRHFLSDIIFACATTFCIAYVMHSLSLRFGLLSKEEAII